MPSPAFHAASLPAPIPGSVPPPCAQGAGITITTTTGTSPVRPVVFV